jgi:hypothetical protein
MSFDLLLDFFDIFGIPIVFEVISFLELYHELDQIGHVSSLALEQLHKEVGKV